MPKKSRVQKQPAGGLEDFLAAKIDEKARAEKFKQLVEKKAHSILNEKIPTPQYLNKKIVDKKTTALALAEMKKFKDEFNRAPTKEEINIIAEAVYRQIKDEAEKKHSKKESASRRSLLEERRKRREHTNQQPQKHARQKELSRSEQRRQERLLRRKKQEEKEGGFGEKDEVPEMGGPSQSLGQSDLSDISIPDLFSDEKDSENLSIDEIAEDKEFGNIEKELEGLDRDTPSVSKDIETDKSKCPNCKTFTQDLVYCPECGAAFCSHCAKSIENLEDCTRFTCPKCSAVFKSKKLG